MTHQSIGAHGPKLVFVAVSIALTLMTVATFRGAAQDRAPDFALHSLPQQSFYLRVEKAELWGWNGHAGHGGGVMAFEPLENVAVLFHPQTKGCWIGNFTEPHNWTPAPVEVCK